MTLINKPFSWDRLQEIKLLWFYRTLFSITIIFLNSFPCFMLYENALKSFVVSHNLSCFLYVSTSTELLSSLNTTWLKSYLFLWWNFLKKSLRVRVKAKSHPDRLHIPICNRRLQRFRITIRFDTRMHHKPFRLVLMLENHLYRRNIDKVSHPYHKCDLVLFAFFPNAFLIQPAWIATNIIYAQLNHKSL